MPRDEVEDMSHQLVWQLIHLQAERRKLLVVEIRRKSFSADISAFCSNLLFHSFPM